MTPKKKLNPYSKRNLVQARLDHEDFQAVLTKAQMFTNGNVSEFVRLAAINYRPIKKVTK